jgi:hypothetical protein
MTLCIGPLAKDLRTYYGGIDACSAGGPGSGQAVENKWLALSDAICTVPALIQPKHLRKIEIRFSRSIPG